MIGSSIVSVAVALAAGASLGAVYMALLWVGVRALARNARPATVFVVLTLLRVALVVAVLLAAARLGAGAVDLAAGVLGFVAVRVAATRWIGAEIGGGGSWK